MATAPSPSETPKQRMPKQRVPRQGSPKAALRKQRAAGRRHPLATVALIMVGLVATGGAYALFSSSATAETQTAAQAQLDEGGKLFAANCATCHGMALQGSTQGPSLIGVGAAAVDFQVGSGRMPLAATGAQAEKKPSQFTDEQVAALASYVASKGPGPAIPSSEYLAGTGDAGKGAELFRINCAMCHNVAGAGGALTEGKYAPPLADISAKHIYEAMATGPQSMPVFNDKNISPEDKANIITYLKYLDKTPSPGGFDLGNLGPVSEGLFIWIFGLGGIVAITIWLTARSN